MKDYVEITDRSLSEIEEEIKRLDEESEKLTEWPDIDNYYDD